MHSSHYNFFQRCSSTPRQPHAPQLPVAFIPPKCTTEKSVRARLTSVSRTKLPHTPLHAFNLFSLSFPFLSLLSALLQERVVNCGLFRLHIKASVLEASLLPRSQEPLSHFQPHNVFLQTDLILSCDFFHIILVWFSQAFGF